MVSILVVDDNAKLRAGMRDWLELESDFRVVGEAADGHTALELAQELRPDVVLADLSMPGPSGIEIAAELRKLTPEMRVLIVSMYEDQSLYREAMMAGAAGYLPKRSLEAELIKAIRTVASGGTYVAPGLRAPAPAQEPASTSSHPLTAAEWKLFDLLAEGLSGQAIAQRLGLSRDQLERQRVALFEKLGLHNRADLVHYAHLRGLI